MHTLVHEQDIRDEGIAIGLERGIEQGIAIGIEQGIPLGRLEMIQNALKGGSSPEEIVRVMGIAPEEITKAQEQLLKSV